MTVATILDSGGSGYVVTNAVLNSAGVSFDVDNDVLNAAGTAFTIFSASVLTPVSVKSDHIHDVTANTRLHTVTANTRTHQT